MVNTLVWSSNGLIRCHNKNIFFFGRELGLFDVIIMVNTFVLSGNGLL